MPNHNTKKKVMSLSKTKIQKILRTRNVTRIFKAAAECGVDVTEKGNVFKFIKKHAPSQAIKNSAYRLSYGAAHFKAFRATDSPLRMPIKDTIQWARHQKINGWMQTNYGKILIEGNTNIFWASPIYRHADYNKSVAMKNTPKNRHVMRLINSQLKK